jgi:mRNA-degrading endonuclease RelE of RelBE toxin-antitoxin system
MLRAIYDSAFLKKFSKIRDILIRDRIIKQIEKIRSNPEVGKPMRNVRKGTRELKIPPFRLSYAYHTDIELVEILDFYHKDEQ